MVHVSKFRIAQQRRFSLEVGRAAWQSVQLVEYAMTQAFRIEHRLLRTAAERGPRSWRFHVWGRVLLQAVLCLGLASFGCQSDKSAEDVKDMASKGDASSSGPACSDVKCANPDNICCSADDPCVDIKTNPRHCGGCGKSCPASAVCANGTCYCRAKGDEICGTDSVCCSDGCHKVLSDSNNCGACGMHCQMGESCVNGRCGCGPSGLGCRSDQTCCSSGCTDLLSDTNNCGACGHQCQPGKNCNAGLCDGDCAIPCTPNTQACCNAVCKNILFDIFNCGGCGIKCTGGNVCSWGVCTPLSISSQ